jgi:hypothetical protein
MQLFFHDKFFDQLIRLPRNVQKGVVTFQRKFRENTRSAAIHLEPINNFKDQNLRTARIDQQYRAIIGCTPSGEDYYLLWVDNHDEAMDWARNKSFEWNDRTQCVQLFDTPLEKIADAKESKEAFVSDAVGIFNPFTDEQLLALGVPEIWLPTVKVIRNLDELGKYEKQLPVEAFENLFYLSDGIPVEKLLEEMQEASQSSDHENRLLQRSFTVADDALLEQLLSGDLQKWQVFLHPSQRKLVEGNYAGPVKVTGGGGTGKTVVAMHRLNLLTKDATIEKPVLFTTFTNALTRNLKGVLGKMQIPISRFDLINIDQLALQIGRKYNLIYEHTRILDYPGVKKSVELWETITEEHATPFDPAFLAKEYRDVWLYNNLSSAEEYFHTSRLGRGKPLTRKQKMDFVNLVAYYEAAKKTMQFLDRGELFNKLFNYLQQLDEKPYAQVIVDEVQDMSTIELRFIRQLTEEKANDLFLVGDPYQNIYGKKINFSKAGISVRGKRSRQLRVNYRTSEEIKRLAISTVKNILMDDFDGNAEKMDGYLSLFHSQPPQYRIFHAWSHEIDFIKEQLTTLQSQGFNFNEIVIGCRLKESLRAVKSFLHKNQMPYYDLPDESGDAKGIHLCTFNSLKGLEYKAVFLCDVHAQTAPLAISNYAEMDEEERAAFLQSERSLLYVAMTRAMYNLIITGTGKKSDLVDL